MQNEALVRALDVCIQQMQSGEKLEQTLELYPQWTADLTPPLEAAQVLRVYNESFQSSPAIPVPDYERFIRSTKHIHRRPGEPGSRRIWGIWLAWLVIILVVLFAVFWGLSIASSTSPGQIISPIKEWWRQTRLELTTDVQQRVALERVYDLTRLGDARDQIDIGQPGSISFPGLLKQELPEAWIVGGIPVQISPQTQVIGSVQDGIWVELTGRLLPGRVVQVSQIRPREYEFTGNLEEIAADSLVVSSVTVKLDTETLVHGSPMAGSQVNVIVYRTAEDHWLARLVDTPEQE